MRTTTLDGAGYLALTLVRKVLSLLFWLAVLCLVALLVCVVALLVLTRIGGEELSVLGHNIYVVLSGSMEPALEVGSLIVVEPVSPDMLAVGDIITYRMYGGIITHRIVAVIENGGLRFVTRGDMNNANDPYLVEAEQVIGRVVRVIPGLGRVLDWLSR